MTSENPYQSPQIEELAPAVPLWRGLVGLGLRIAAVTAGLLAIAMFLGGANWLRIEFAHGLPLSLSVALLSGAIVAAAVCAAFGWSARRVSGRITRLVAIAIAVWATILCAGGLFVISEIYS